MSARPTDPRRDRARPLPAVPVTIVVDGEPLTGVLGQSIAGVVLAAGRHALRSTARSGAPRGVFCGIGVCFDCLVTVDGQRDVRACQRRAAPGAIVTSQREPLPVPVVAPDEGGVRGAAHGGAEERRG